MKIRLENTNVDPRIYDVTIDFTGYHQNVKYSYWRGKHVVSIPPHTLDDLLKPLKLRRISWWRSKEVRYSKVYFTTVISDRMNKRNDVG